jgi:AcrR family transcriptional regulator
MPTEKHDRRSQRTRRLLGDALVGLLAEKRFDAISVQDLVDRANVGRTTFYAHFTDKEDLLLSEIERMVHRLAAAPAAPHRPLGPAGLPSRLLFEHVREFQPVYQALTWGRGSERLFQKIETQVAALVEEGLAERARPETPPGVPLPVLGRYVAGTLLTLLKWWMDTKLAYTPEQMQALFTQLVQPSLDAALAAPPA